MATVSKDSKKINTLKEEFERRDLNVHSIRRVIKNSLEIIQNPFGNYVVQTLFNEHFENEKDNWIGSIGITCQFNQFCFG